MKRQWLGILCVLLIPALLTTCKGGGGGGTGGAAAVITGSAGPSVVAKSTDGVCGIDVTIAVAVTFGSDMTAASLNTGSFTLSRDTVQISGTVTYDASTRTATFTPAAPLDYGTVYRAAVTMDAQDSSGNAMKSSYAWNFTTKQASTTAGPLSLLGGAMQGRELALSSANAAVTTFAGSGTAGSAEGTGTAAAFYNPYGVTTDGTHLYVADTNNHKIRKIVIATAVVTTLAGSGTAGSTDGTGTAAKFNTPMGITTDGTNLFVADYNNHRIRKIVIASGAVTTLAGSGSAGSTDATGTAAQFNNPAGITTDGMNLYVSDSTNNKIRKIVIATAVVTTLAGSGGIGASDGTGTAASFHYPAGITTDGTNLYVCDNNNHTVRRIVMATGAVTTLAGSAGSIGATDGTGAAARFSSSHGIITDGTNLYVADTENNSIRRIVIATGAVTTLAGSGVKGYADGTGRAALFFNPTGVTTDGSSLFVADIYNNRIRRISAPTTAPPAPQSVWSDSGDGRITLFWDPVDGATSYNIYWSGTASDVTTATGALIACVESPYALAGLTNGTPLYFIVTAKNDVGEGPPTVWGTSTPAAQYTLSVARSGAGSGSVSSSPAGISCGAVCTASVTNGLEITLTAAASAGSVFAGWSGDCSGTGSCTVTMNANKSVTAKFNSTSGGGSGGGYYWYNWNCTSSACASFFNGKYTGSLGPFCTLSDCSSWAVKYNLVDLCSNTPIYTIESAATKNGVCAQNGVDFSPAK